MNSFQWYPSESAPRSYPAEILSGVFILENTSFVNSPLLQFAENSWGQRQSIYLVGEDKKLMPIALRIVWMSFVEQKIYSGVFDLLPDEFRSGFEEGFISPFDNAQKSYDYIVIGMAPGGHLSIWLNGDGLSKEVAYLKCNHDKAFNVSSIIGTTLSLKDYIQSRILDYNPVLLESNEFFNQAISDKWGVLYRQEVHLNLQIISFIDPFSVKISFFNGEVVYFLLDDIKVISITKIPSELRFKWIELDDERQRSSKYIFFEKEIFEAIKVLSADTNENLKLMVLLSEIDYSIKVVLKNATSFVNL